MMVSAIIRFLVYFDFLYFSFKCLIFYKLLFWSEILER